MATKHWLLPLLVLVFVASPMVGVVRADMFGTGTNALTIDFVTVGNAGNSNDRALDTVDDTPGDPTDDSYSSPYGGVAYTFRMAVTELSQTMIDKATASGMSHVTAGAFIGNKPAGCMGWYEAAAFVNWLNESTGHHAAYNLSWSLGPGWSMTLWDASDRASTGVDSGTNPFRHKDARYFLPSEDEWYKAAFHQNNGVTSDYWDYATSSNVVPTSVTSGTAPGTAVIKPASGPADVNLAGGLSPYGTMGQDGNVLEWMESTDNGNNDNAGANRVQRGGFWNVGGPMAWAQLRSCDRMNATPGENTAPSEFGFRVAAVPEPISGDTNGDGKVDAADAVAVAAHWGMSGMGVADGDFNGDGAVNAADASILAANWGHGTSEAGRVPEPGVIAFLLALGGFVIARRR
jgi:formylglycine-generating enzyme